MNELFNTLPTFFVLASGGPGEKEGGSGLEKLQEAIEMGHLRAKIVGIGSNHANGGVREKADRFKIPFFHLPKAKRNAEEYQRLVRETKADFVVLSGYIFLVEGLEPGRTVNIHPGRTDKFGGPGMHGDHVHQATMEAFVRGEVSETAVTMHFVTPEYDKGPVLWEFRIKIRTHDTWKTLKKRVNGYEHRFQAIITNLVVNGLIRLRGDGTNNDPWSVIVPKGYEIRQGEYI